MLLKLLNTIGILAVLTCLVFTSCGRKHYRAAFGKPAYRYQTVIQTEPADKPGKASVGTASGKTSPGLRTATITSREAYGPEACKPALVYGLKDTLGQAALVASLKRELGILHDKQAGFIKQMRAGLRLSSMLKKSKYTPPFFNYTNDDSYKERSQFIAFVLCLYLGIIGIHRFYLGYNIQGFFMIYTYGGALIWWFIDLIRIVSGDLKPNKGIYYDLL